MTKQMIYWLLGDRTGRVIVATWNWLWGLPIEMSGDIAKEVAQESLETMQQSVLKLTEAAATVMAAYQQAKQIYDSKQQEFQNAESQALLAYRNGQEQAAQLAMGHAIQLEGLLPQLLERVQHAEELVTQTKAKLNQEHQRVEAYKVQMHNLKALADVNKALDAITQTTSTLKLDSARSQFDAAETAIKRQHYKGKAQAELSVNPTEQLQGDLDRLTLNEKIAQKFEQFNTSMATLPQEKQS